MSKRIRVLIAKPGLDGHERGARVVALALKNAGMEVIYTGIRQTPEKIAKAAIEEDVDVIGLSVLSGAHVEVVSGLVDELKKYKLNVPIIVGGIIPEEDKPVLLKLGVKAIAGPGSPLEDVIETVRKVAAEQYK